MQVPSSIPEALVNLPQGRDSASRPIVVAAQAIDGQLVLDSRAAVLTLQPATGSGEGSETRASLEADQLIRLLDPKLGQPDDTAPVGQGGPRADANLLKSLIDHLSSPALKTTARTAVVWPDPVDSVDSSAGEQKFPTDSQQVNSVVHLKMRALYLGLATSGIFASRHLASVICGVPFSLDIARNVGDFAQASHASIDSSKSTPLALDNPNSSYSSEESLPESDGTTLLRAAHLDDGGTPIEISTLEVKAKKLSESTSRFSETPDREEIGTNQNSEKPKGNSIDKPGGTAFAKIANLDALPNADQRPQPKGLFLDRNERRRGEPRVHEQATPDTTIGESSDILQIANKNIQKDFRDSGKPVWDETFSPVQSQNKKEMQVAGSVEVKINPSGEAESSLINSRPAENQVKVEIETLGPELDTNIPPKKTHIVSTASPSKELSDSAPLLVPLLASDALFKSEDKSTGATRATTRAAAAAASLTQNTEDPNAFSSGVDYSPTDLVVGRRGPNENDRTVAKEPNSPLHPRVIATTRDSSVEDSAVDRSVFARVMPSGDELRSRSKDLEVKHLNEWFASINSESPDAVGASNLLLNGRMEWAGLLAPGIPMLIERYDAWRGSHTGAGVAEKGAALRVEVQLPSLGVLRIEGAQWGSDLQLRVSGRDGQVAALAGWGDLVSRLEKSLGASLHETNWSDSADEVDQ